MLIVRGANALALVLVLALVPSAQAAPWRVLDASPAHGVAAGSVRAFAPALARASGAEPAITEARDGATAAAAVTAAQAELAVFPLRVLAGDEPALGIAEVAYLATSFIDARKLWQVLQPRVEQALSVRGMALLYGVPSPPAAPLSRLPLTSMGALRGVTQWLAEPGHGALSRLLGTQPVDAASGRVALGSGIAQLMFAPPDAAARDSAWEYASHYLHAPAWFPFHVVAVNRSTLVALDGARRAALLGAADEAAASAWTQAERSAQEAVQMLRDYGIKTARVPVNMLIQLEAVGRDLLFQWSEGAGEAGAEMVEAYYLIR